LATEFRPHQRGDEHSHRMDFIIPTGLVQKIVLKRQPELASIAAAELSGKKNNFSSWLSPT